MRFCPVEESRCAVAQVSATTAAHLAAGCQCLADPTSSVDEVDQRQHGLLVAVFAHDGDPGGFAAWVEFDAHGLELAVCCAAIHQPDDEWHNAVNACAASLQQEPCAFL